MYQIVVTPAAKEDIKDAAKWYNFQKANLGKILIARFNEKASDIKNNPFIVQVRFDDVRVAFLKQFPYSIHYKVKEELKTIVIHAFFHEHRNPEEWKDRM